MRRGKTNRVAEGFGPWQLALIVNAELSATVGLIEALIQKQTEARTGPFHWSGLPRRKTRQDRERSTQSRSGIYFQLLGIQMEIPPRWLTKYSCPKCLLSIDMRCNVKYKLYIPKEDRLGVNRKAPVFSVSR